MPYLQLSIIRKIFSILASPASSTSRAERGRKPHANTVKIIASKKRLYPSSKGQFMKTSPDDRGFLKRLFRACSRLARGGVTLLFRLAQCPCYTSRLLECYRSALASRFEEPCTSRVLPSKQSMTLLFFLQLFAANHNIYLAHNLSIE